MQFRLRSVSRLQTSAGSRWSSSTIMVDEPSPGCSGSSPGRRRAGCAARCFGTGVSQLQPPVAAQLRSRLDPTDVEAMVT
jgi:hypothetical protein